MEFTEGPGWKRKEVSRKGANTKISKAMKNGEKVER